jgi:ubiquinone/menaquinone biosynthesis C-methylase UbiE/DNA-binding transcriptional ArsR family regulator
MATGTEPPIFHHMAALADGARCRLLLVLEENELTVSELCAVLQMPQSTVSRHLKVLADGGWVDSRPEGTRRLYHGAMTGQEPAARQLWDLTRAEVAATRSGHADRQRLQSVLARRRSRSQEFFDATGENWDQLRDELFGKNLHLAALAGLVPGDWMVGDLGCGTGLVTEALAPFVRGVIGVDGSASMLERAQARLERFENVELRHGELTSLPLEDGEVDAVTFILVLHHVQDPRQAIAEAARVLRPGGRILVVDMVPHDRAQYQKEMGHVWLGFSEDVMRGYLTRAGFTAPRFQALPPDPEAKGPNLFAVSASVT